MARSTLQTFELEQFVHEILANFKSPAEKNGIELQVKGDIASSVLLNGNTKKIKFLLDTVLQNTIMHSGATRICFFTRQLLKTNSDILIEFVLEDNGITARRPFIYYRTLVIAKSMINDLDGKSELILAGGHSTLKFVIKCACKSCDPQHDITQVSAYTEYLKTKQVLIVEDNEINQLSIIHILQKEGVAFQVASNGKEAIDMLEKMNSCDLVIMDLEMPYMDGFDATNYIRKKLKSKVPIIGMISGEDKAHALRCIEAGMNQFIKKPFKAEELLLQACSFFGPEFYKLEPVRSVRRSA
jgi:CheY-like chemotaxis protein